MNSEIKIKRFNINEINPAIYNPRKISDEALLGLTSSLERFGVVEPIIINVRDGKNVIVGGHQRHKALLASGVSDIDCVTVDLSKDDEKLLNLSLNNPNIQGEFIDNLQEYLNELTFDLDEQIISDLRISQMISETPEPKMKASGELTPVIQYSIIFDDTEQQENWYKLLKYLKNAYPHEETISARLNAFIEVEIDGKM